MQAITEQIVENLIRIHPLLSKSLNKSIRIKTNLNPGSLYVLGLISRHEYLSMTEIGCKLSMPKPHVTAHIDKLIAEGMVVRLLDANDRRIVNIAITDKGKEDLKQIKQEVSIEIRQKLDSLDEERLQLLLEASATVRSVLSDVMNYDTTCSKTKI